MKELIASLFLTASLLAQCFCFTSVAQTVPGDARSAGLYYIVPDMACWFNTAGNYVTNGFIKRTEAASPAELGNWEPYTGVLGDSTFLIGFNTYANDGTLADQNYVVAKQSASGGAPRLDYEFWGDNGTPFKGKINLSRQNGNPQRVAGDKRVGATTFITEAEGSFGQLAPFQLINRWGNNNIYRGTNRYAAEQLFSLDTNTLAQTPVTYAWDYVYGLYGVPMGPSNDAPQCTRTGGRCEFLDNGNIVVMIEDRTAIASTAGQVTTFAIIQPNGTIVRGATLVDPNPIWDNLCAFQGGFCIRVGASLYFFDNYGNLAHSNNLAVANANLKTVWGFTGGYNTGRGDETRVASDIRSPYVFMAGGVQVGAGANACMMAAWNGQTGAFITNVMVSSDLDPSLLTVDRTSLAVDMSNRVCVAFAGQANKNGGYQNQVIARVMQFTGTNVSHLCPSFFAFVNSDNAITVANNGAVKGFTTIAPNVSMTTKAICIAAKGIINSTNNPYSPSSPDSPAGNTTVYTVITMPVSGSGGCIPHRATATATVVNGVVVRVTINDGGCGYTNAPAVLIQGGGGSGATATAEIIDGVVVFLHITNGGSGYTSPPVVYIGPPLGAQIQLLKAVKPSFLDLSIGMNYQLQVSGDLNSWTNQGPPFTATSRNMTYPQYWDMDNWGQLFFRLQISP